VAYVAAVSEDPFADSDAVVRLPPHPSAASAARRFVCETISSWGLPPPDDTSLLTSEVVTNALNHAEGNVAIRVRRENNHAFVEVHDHQSEPPVQREVDPQRRGGNGLILLDALAECWGVTQIHDDGKIVWFEVPLPSSGQSGERGADRNAG
jgi:anti-sigma regulatory factor (Ser/Thr protein kinase)